MRDLQMVIWLLLALPFLLLGLIAALIVTGVKLGWALGHVFFDRAFEERP